MDKILNFMIIGGDSRFSYMRQILEERGYNAKRIYPGEYKADDFSDVDVFILPVPVSRDNVNINAPLAGEAFYFGDFLRLLPEDCIVAGGLWNGYMVEKLEKKNIRVIDYYKNEELALLNAVPTAEGVIGILIDSLPVTVDGLACVVTGYGKCGSALSKKLKALGADVTVAARSRVQLAAAATDGMKTCRISELGKNTSGKRAIINTVPARIIDSDIIKNLDKDCIIVEIASAPFGIDFDAASKYGITAIKAGSLPGKVSPLSAGRIICDTVLSYLRE